MNLTFSKCHETLRQVALSAPISAKSPRFFPLNVALYGGNLHRASINVPQCPFLIFMPAPSKKLWLCKRTRWTDLMRLEWIMRTHMCPSFLLQISISLPWKIIPRPTNFPPSLTGIYCPYPMILGFIAIHCDLFHLALVSILCRHFHWRQTTLFFFEFETRNICSPPDPCPPDNRWGW